MAQEVTAPKPPSLLPVLGWFALYGIVAAIYGIGLWWAMARASVATGWMVPGGALFITTYVVSLVGLPFAALLAYANIVVPRRERKWTARIDALIESDPAGAFAEVVARARESLDVEDVPGIYRMVPLLDRLCAERGKRELADFCGSLNKLQAHLKNYGRPGYASHLHEDLVVIEMEEAIRKDLAALEAAWSETGAG